jgi:hypothetical protein
MALGEDEDPMQVWPGKKKEKKRRERKIYYKYNTSFLHTYQWSFLRFQA